MLPRSSSRPAADRASCTWQHRGNLMRRTTLCAFFLAATALAFVATPGRAQVSTTRGFTIGLHGSGASLVVEDDDRSNAGGGGLIVGYGINRRITLFAQADGAEFDDPSTGDVEGTWTMGHFDLGVRFNFANSLKRYVPFLQGALGARAVSVSDPIVNGTARNTVSLSGAGLTLGGGLDVYFSQSWAMDLQLLWTGGSFTTLTVDNASLSGFDIKANSTRFNIGVLWWP